MVIAFPCESCGKQFEVDGALAGKKCKCKQCGHIFAIPTPRQSASPRRNLQTFDTPDKTPTATASRSAPGRPKPAPPPASNPYDDLEPRSAPGRPKPAPPPAHDPYDDLAPPSVPTARLDDDEELLPPRQSRPVPVKKKKKKKRGKGFSVENVPGWVYLVFSFAILAAIIVACTSRTGMALVGGGAVIVGLIMWVIGGVGLVVVAFRESIACGLLYLFLPFYALYYLVTRWEDTRRFFLLGFCGWLMVIGMGLFLPAVQAARNAADRARGGGGPSSEVETIISGLIDANHELADLLTTVNNVPDAERIAPQYIEIRDRIDDLDRRMKALPPLSAFDNQRLGFQYNLRLNGSTDRVIEQNKRLAAIPGVFPHLNQVRQAHLAPNGPPGPDADPALNGSPPPGVAPPRIPRPQLRPRLRPRPNFRGRP